MLRIHTKDGLTTHVDLKNEEQAKEWLSRRKSHDFQTDIAGVSLVQRFNGTTVQYSLPRPEDFDQIFYHAEDVPPSISTRFKGGERVVCFVDDVRVTMLVHRKQHSVRIALKKMGKHTYNPMSE